MPAKFRREIIEKVIDEKNARPGYYHLKDCYKLKLFDRDYYAFICPTGVYIDSEHYGYESAELDTVLEWIPKFLEELERTGREVNSPFENEKNKEFASAAVPGRTERIYITKKLLNRTTKFTGNTSLFMSAEHDNFDPKGFYKGLLVSYNLPTRLAILAPVRRRQAVDCFDVQERINFYE